MPFSLFRLGFDVRLAGFSQGLTKQKERHSTSLNNTIEDTVAFFSVRAEDYR